MSVKQVFNTSAELDYPTVLPTLDLDFANSKTLDPRITFTRASGGSYVGADGLIKLAGVNEARFDHDPVTGESLGLLIEESRSNLITYSEQFNDASWAKGNLSVTANTTATTAPDGTNSAEKLIESLDVGTTFHIITSIGFSATSGTSYTYSIFVKAAERTKVIMGFSVGSAFSNFQFGLYDLSAGTSSIFLGTPTVSITPYPNGWYRCSVTATATATGTAFASLQLYTTSNGYIGDGTSGIYLWGAQLEQASFPTSYIPTVASTRTRAADNASITGRNFREWYRQDEGPLIAKARSYNLTASTFPHIAAIDDGTSNNRIGVGYIVSSVGGVFIRNNNVGQVEIYPLVNTNPRTGSLAYKLNDAATSYNGGTVLTDPSVSIPTVTKMQIGDFGTSLNTIYNLNGYISRLSYYPKRLPNSQLISLTS
jgi:hypothetical protein